MKNSFDMCVCCSGEACIMLEWQIFCETESTEKSRKFSTKWKTWKIVEFDLLEKGELATLCCIHVFAIKDKNPNQN